MKITQNVSFEFFELWHFYQFLSYYYLSGNIVSPQVLGFQKLAKMDHFWHFWLTFVHSNCPTKINLLITLFDRKLRFSKTRPNWLILAFSINIVHFCSLAMKNETFFCDFQTLYVHIVWKSPKMSHAMNNGNFHHFFVLSGNII